MPQTINTLSTGRTLLLMMAGCLLAVLPMAVRSSVARAEGGPEWRPLFDGRELGQWRSTPFGGEGAVTVEEMRIRISAGSEMSGITWGGEFPTSDYEVSLEARRDDGIDFFCGLTFPVGEDWCSLIVGGWGGSVVGLSSIDGFDAANNHTTQSRSFESGRWYRVGIRVTAERIVCTLDGETIIDQEREGRRFSLRDEVLPSRPLGIATYATAASLRDIRWRPLAPP